MTEATNSDDSTMPYIHPNLKKSLDKGKHLVKTADMDRVYVVDGREGYGKSTFAMQLGYYLDPNLSLDNIVFSSKQFKERIRNAKKFSVIIWDECFKGLSSKGSLSRENKEIVSLLQECRQRNLFIFLVLPSIFLLEKYPAIFRSEALYHISAVKRNKKLRFVKVFNYSNKKLLYLLGKSMMDYSKPRIVRAKYRFYGKIPPTIDKSKYDAKKLEAFRSSDKQGEREIRPQQQRDWLYYTLNKEYGLSYREIEEIMRQGRVKHDQSNIGRIIRSISDKRQKTKDMYNINM